MQVRSQRRAYWAWFDHALIDDYAQHLGPIGVALYVALARYANHHTGQCWPSLVRLSHQLGITRLTARRYLQRLADQGLIALQERPGHTFLAPCWTSIRARRPVYHVNRGRGLPVYPINMGMFTQKAAGVSRVNTNQIS